MDNPNNTDPSARVLADFLKAFATPVEGLGREELTAEQEQLLLELAAGTLDEQVRSTLISLLAGNEIAMEFLADAARDRSGSSR